MEKNLTHVSEEGGGRVGGGKGEKKKKQGVAVALIGGEKKSQDEINGLAHLGVRNRKIEK